MTRTNRDTNMYTLIQDPKLTSRWVDKVNFSSSDLSGDLVVSNCVSFQGGSSFIRSNAKMYSVVNDNKKE